MSRECPKCHDPDVPNNGLPSHLRNDCPAVSDDGADTSATGTTAATDHDPDADEVAADA